jgi:hypothetical protein
VFDGTDRLQHTFWRDTDAASRTGGEDHACGEEACSSQGREPLGGGRCSSHSRGAAICSSLGREPQD